jgi:hypothetical protein
MNIRHSSRTDRWFTPTNIILLAKAVLGDIDLDPASEERANAIVGAKQYITQEQDGLLTPWCEGSIFLNPPGGKIKNKSLSALFWAKLMAHRNDLKFKHGVFMGFSVEQLAVTQNYNCESMLMFPICIPKKRIEFVSPVAVKEAPSHSNVVVYVPGSINNTDRFVEVFSTLGVVKI